MNCCTALPSIATKAHFKFWWSGIYPSERAFSRSQELAKSLQLDAAQRNAVFAELMTRKAEDPERIKALLNEIQAQDYDE